MKPDSTTPSLLDLAPAAANVTAEACAGLGATPKTLPCKFFYDQRGSELFEQICELEEYYPTRTEIGILRERAGEIAAALGPRVHLVEPGSGAGVKTSLLLDALEEPVACTPLDISREFLLASAVELNAEYPELEVLPVCAEFLQHFDVPRPVREAARRVVFFPGSTIGNFEGEEARALLDWMAELAGPGGALLIGADLRKDPARLEAAYDDARGVTAEFNRNALTFLNREVGADFDLARFAHRAVWNAGASRIEMHLVSRGAQTVHLAGEAFDFADGESILTEVAHKFGPDELAELATAFRWVQTWTDREGLFTLQLFDVRAQGSSET